MLRICVALGFGVKREKLFRGTRTGFPVKHGQACREKRLTLELDSRKQGLVEGEGRALARRSQMT